MNTLTKPFAFVLLFAGLSSPIHALPTTQTCSPPDGSGRITCVSTNPPLPSAKGGAWSPDYYIKAADPPTGYRLESATFELLGPHPCHGDDTSTINPQDHLPWGAGSWAKCRRTSRDEGNVTWAYSIQGQQGKENWSISGQGLQWTKNPDSTVSEAAKITLVYVKSG